MLKWLSLLLEIVWPTCHRSHVRSSTGCGPWIISEFSLDLLEFKLGSSFRKEFGLASNSCGTSPCQSSDEGFKEGQNFRSFVTPQDCLFKDVGSPCSSIQKEESFPVSLQDLPHTGMHTNTMIRPVSIPSGTQHSQGTRRRGRYQET